MKINAFRAIRFDAVYWSNQNRLNTSNSDDKIKQTENNLSYLNDNISRGVAKVDAAPGLYVLRITSSSKRVTSIIGEIDYNEKSVLFMNENIHPQKLARYKLLFQQYKIQTNPVLTFYKNGISINTVVAKILRSAPSFAAHIDGLFYELWCVTNPVEIGHIREELKQIDRLYIADGHHRFSLFTGLNSKISAKLIISVTDANSILLKSCHKIVCGSVSPNWREKISQFGTVEKIDRFDDVGGKIVLMFPRGSQSSVYESFAIDVRDKILNKNIFDIVKENIIEFGFGVTNYDENVFPLPGNVTPNDADNLFNLYRNAAVAIFVPSINITDFLSVIDDGHKLPATSTWFEPKITDGFIARKF